MIEGRNFTRHRVDKRFVEKIVQRTLRETGIKGTISVGVVFVGKVRMSRINKKYRHKNKTADVLSFGVDGRFISSGKEKHFLGEILVCPSAVMHQSKKMNVSFTKELAHVLVHGTLHLVGWRHKKSGKSTDEMHDREKEIMSSFLAF